MTPFWRRWPALVAVGAAALATQHAQADSPGEKITRRVGGKSALVQPIRKRRKYSLKRCLELAARNYPKVHASKAQLKRVKAQLQEARYAPYSQFSAQGGVGVAPTVRGTTVYSPNTDVALTSSMALAWQVSFQGVIPLWTFGKITGLRDAAAAQVRVKSHELKKQQNDVKLLVYEAYYGLQLARDSVILVKKAASQIDKHLASLEEKVEDGDGDEIELLKMKMNRAELDARESQAAKQATVALSGLKFLVGVKNASFDIPDLPIQRTSHPIAPLARYLSAARLHRPEVNMARAGVAARRAQLALQRAKFFPDVGLGFTGRWARAPEVTDQVNPYSNDGGNFLQYGAAITLRWSLDFLPQIARHAQARSQLEEMRATEQFALGGIAVEVEKAYADAIDAKRRLNAFTRAARYAKQWLIKVQQGIDIGTMDDEDIVDPAKEYALKKFARMSATFDYNMAVARLAVATGWNAAFPLR